MQKTIIAATVAAVLGCGAANAADVYSSGGYKEAPIVPVSSWTGFYFGVNTGLVWGAGSDKVDVTGYEYDYKVDPSKNLDTIGGFGGGQIGYNWQSGKLVYGIEADLQTALAHDKAGAAAVGDYSIAAAAAKSELEWFGTVRGRLGYLLFPNTLVYATGGFAYGGVKDKLSVTSISGWIDTEGAKKDETATGYVAGGGVEYAITPNWSVKGEYQYIDLGSSLLKASAWAECASAEGKLTVDHQYHTFRLGINYKLSSGYEPLK